MATYVERTNKSGNKKIKAIARCWVKGKQVNKTKSFPLHEKHLAIEWAEGIEAKMRDVKTNQAQGAGRYTGDEVKPFSELLLERREAIQRIENAFSLHVSIITINTSSLIEYFKKRADQGGTLEEVVVEKKVLKLLIAELTGDEVKRGNMVETAYDAALCDGVFFK